LDPRDGAFDGQVLVRGRLGLHAQADAVDEEQPLALAGIAAGHEPDLAAALVAVPDGHRERSARPVGDAHDAHAHVGEERLALARAHACVGHRAPQASNTIPLRAAAPLRISSKAWFTWSSLSRAEIISSSFSWPDR